jgi:hypothetical protein
MAILFANLGLPQFEANQKGETEMAEKYLSMKEASTVLRVSGNTLLNLERKGFLHPARDFRGWRVYSSREIERERERRKILRRG